MIETTQSVKIDIEDAKKLYELIKLGVNITGYKIDGYTVTSLNGHLVVGCHRINTNNMHEIGKQL
jgi:hypothetical protein